MINLYRILSYLLLPVALLLGITSLIGLLMALGNLAVLLPVFVCGATAIYIIASFLFLQRVIESQRTVKHSLRDWVRANGFVASFFAILILVQSFTLMNNPAVMNEAMEQAAKMQQVEMPKDMMMKSIKLAFTIMQVISVLLIAHILLGFRMLRRYQAYFLEENKD